MVDVVELDPFDSDEMEWGGSELRNNGEELKLKVVFCLCATDVFKLYRIKGLLMITIMVN